MKLKYRFIKKNYECCTKAKQDSKAIWYTSEDNVMTGSMLFRL